MSEVPSEIAHKGDRFAWNTRYMDYSETKIPEGQKTDYGYGYRDPDLRDVLTALDTITTIVKIWQTLTGPVVCEIINDDESHGRESPKIA